MTWDDMNFWKSGEWDVIQERLDDLETRDATPSGYNPSRDLIFAGLDATPIGEVSIAIIGQDPYPSAKHCTGIAFDVPIGVSPPPTLRNIFEEYKKDLHYSDPPSGSLKKWTQQGILLWNVYPTCTTGKPGSHHWPEWMTLSEEIVSELDKKKVVFALLGSIAGSLSEKIKESPIIKTSHPSPLGATKGKHPFLGSRLFSTINGKLKDIGKPSIDWKL